MNLQGKHTYKATPQQIWDLLMDTEKLAKITPGVSKLELIGDDQYNAISNVKIGPVKGSFKGDLFLVDKEEPSKFTLKVKQLSKIGNADATVDIYINALDNDQTELAFDGKAKLSGTLARTGQRVLNGVANTLTKQFFQALGEEVEASDFVAPEPAPVAVKEVPIPAPSVKQPLESSIVEKDSGKSGKETTSETGFFAWLKKLFGF